jgi:hypothetical protein
MHSAKLVACKSVDLKPADLFIHSASMNRRRYELVVDGFNVRYLLYFAGQTQLGCDIFTSVGFNNFFSRLKSHIRV